MLPDDPFELGEIVGDDAMELNGRSRLVVLLGDLAPLLVNEEGSRYWKQQISWFKVRQVSKNISSKDSLIRILVVGMFLPLSLKLIFNFRK